MKADIPVDLLPRWGKGHLMTDTPSNVRELITSAINEYLRLLQREPADTLKELGELARAMDRLVLCYHDTPDVGPETTDSEAPRVDEVPFIERASAAFPDLDWYALVDPEGGPDQQVGMSIAVGDLVEIAVDLLEVLWLFDNASENDALWQFRWGYQNHWGRHLHELRVYLHALAAW